ncbi:CD151 antigen [Lingula anatina]|uniref:Tetraspanin n=1 Tax=Lingula anatina TaxID=7574 RepID=A0A1S3K3N3_LINAN|nr:CD151 antigen [Lingula anatina]XP_013417133.1 CD151 antigen [Lingula anatina]XP_013417134.1 CD151 antigen [Lingula anatina]XP_013417135.1 CD151 antigen [Lingula anatina]XP_013417137.1 CD151 antigen [Lingula anatina]XP_013417138.1 CD151 antigen [Lingula anatina]XP_013417139.1 CD151 antigen [Lingula anatina]XP_013417140.1 CD151 antigen [Lingula anatina]XP_013417141.1 CD151 antigen [Lingula anatina]XP_013417142.1 CD151 antigen [Lingula anatina]XP_013417143.1 CD151 antigen [Lingula anatina|eukprot:XP_013417132.1 CD151 antigen [Lingula anatina]
MSNLRDQRSKKKFDEGCCGLFFLKYALCTFNIIFWLSGAAILAVGIWTVLARHHYVSLLATSIYPVTTYILIVTGGIAVIMGFIGCYGAIWENRCCLMTYAFFLVLIFLMEAITGVLAYTYQAAIEQELQRSLNKTMMESYQFDMAITNATDDLQQWHKCCGTGSFEDWRYSKWLRSVPTNNTAPDSCCKSTSTGCAVRNHPSNIYYDGCLTKLARYLKGHIIIIGAVGLGMCFVQVFGIIFACCLARRIKEWNEYRYQQPTYM